MSTGTHKPRGKNDKEDNDKNHPYDFHKTLLPPSLRGEDKPDYFIERFWIARRHYHPSHLPLLETCR